MLSAGIQWMSPSKTGKAGIVPVGCNPFCAALDGKRGQVSIRNEVAFGIGLAAETLKYIPVTFAGCKRHSVGMVSY